MVYKILEEGDRNQHHMIKTPLLLLFPVRCSECGLVNYCKRKTDIQRALTSHLLNHYCIDPEIKKKLLTK